MPFTHLERAGAVDKASKEADLPQSMSDQQQRSVRDVFVARQPILNPRGKVLAYELLYRSSAENAYRGEEPALATSRLITNSLLNIGLDRLVTNRQAFINFDREMLVNGSAEMLPRESVVIELLEDIEPDDEVLSACRSLKDKGYVLALDDFVAPDGYDRLLPMIDIIKVDFRLTKPAAQESFAKRYAASSIKMLAEKVETQDEFTRARDMGYQLFQGYFFTKPTIVVGKEVPGFKLNYVRVLEQINQSELDFGSLSEVLKSEPSLVHKLLRYVNSAVFSGNREVESIRHALVLLGECEVRRWISLVALAGMAGDKPHELIASAIVRGRFCELMSSAAGLRSRQDEMFLLGMFSLLDGILDMRMEDALSQVGLSDELCATLLRLPSAKPQMRHLLDLAIAQERADWDTAQTLAAKCKLPVDELTSSYLASVDWAEKVFRGDR